jgi:iron(III) transport system ATP-binding protein
MYLTLQNVSKVFPARGGVGEVTAVNNVSLEIERGELVTLLGPSGCGKTTTLRLIAGFDFPTAGKIWLDGAEIDPLPPNKRGMSMVFQSYAIFPHLNVFENIAYGLNVRRLPQSKIKKQVSRVLDLVHLAGYEQRAPNQLSGGQQQRVALARALVMEPKVLLMDEPLSNLDAKLRDQMRTEIRRIQKAVGITSVYVTHDQIEAMTLSDKIVVMNQGVIEQIGTPVEVYRYPTSQFVADFIGRAYFAKGVVQSVRNDTLEISTLGKTIKLVHCRGEFKPKDNISLIIRPEMVTVRKSGGLFKGIIRRAVYLGNVIEYDIEVSGLLITGTESDPSRQELFPEGTSVTVDLACDCIQVLRD